MTTADRDRGQMLYRKHAQKNIGVSVVRAGRELMLDPAWCIGYDPRERWWGAEVEFPRALDEVFGVTNKKQAATHFAELATMDWQQLGEGDEEFRDVVERLKEEGDHRGYLLPLQDSIKRNLTEIRKIVASQGRKRRSTHGDRHQRGKPDETTDRTNERWRKRSEARPIPGEDRPRTEDDYEEIRKDLIDQEYTEPDASALLKLIRDADLQVVFLEADFPNSIQLFNVEMKGNLTAITFNRKHPAFPDIFDTLNTVDPGPLLRAGTSAASRAESRYPRALGRVRPGVEPGRHRFRAPRPQLRPEFHVGFREVPVGDPVVDRALGDPEHLFQIRDPEDAGARRRGGTGDGGLIRAHARIPSTSGNWHSHIHGFQGVTTTCTAHFGQKCYAECYVQPDVL